MGENSLEKMVNDLKNCCGENLLSVVLYGSAAAGDHTGKNSDYNLLVVAKSLDMNYLREISKVSVRWVRQGNPPPLLFTMDRLKTSTDVFPVEFEDIRENHRLLYGTDPMENLSISRQNLRLELEHELKGKLIQLRERFLLTEGKPKLVSELMIHSLSTFLILFKSALRLYDEKPPLKKMEALTELQKHIPCDVEVFQIVERLKRGEKLKELDSLELFKRYLQTVENVVDGIDRFIHQSV